MDHSSASSVNGLRQYGGLFILGLAALGLIALAPAQSKVDDGFCVYVSPGYHQDRPYYYDAEGYRHYRHADEYPGGTVITTATF